MVRNGAYLLKDSSYSGLWYSSALFGNLSGLFAFWATGFSDIYESELEEASSTGFALGEQYGYSQSAIADFNNDGWDDLVIMGTTEDGMAFEWYDNQSEEKSFGWDLSDGDFEVWDIDDDGDLDILACGVNADIRTIPVCYKH